MVSCRKSVRVGMNSRGGLSFKEHSLVVLVMGVQFTINLFSSASSCIRNETTELPICGGRSALWVHERNYQLRSLMDLVCLKGVIRTLAKYLVQRNIRSRKWSRKGHLFSRNQPLTHINKSGRKHMLLEWTIGKHDSHFSIN